MHFNRSQWGPVVEGRPYDLECNVEDVVPAANLSVLWHKGNKMLSEKLNFSSTSNNASSSIRLLPHRDDDGIEMWCEAKLDSLPTGQEPKPPAVQSERRTITVNCEGFVYFFFLCNSKILSSLGSNFSSDCILI